PVARLDHRFGRLARLPFLRFHCFAPATEQQPCSALPAALARRAGFALEPRLLFPLAQAQKCVRQHPKTEPPNYRDIASAQACGRPHQPAPPGARHRPSQNESFEIVPTTPSADKVRRCPACRAWPTLVNLDRSECGGAAAYPCDSDPQDCSAIRASLIAAE